jgi:hypothetical protein
MSHESNPLHRLQLGMEGSPFSLVPSDEIDGHFNTNLPISRPFTALSIGGVRVYVMPCPRTLRFEIRACCILALRAIFLDFNHLVSL